MQALGSIAESLIDLIIGQEITPSPNNLEGPSVTADPKKIRKAEKAAETQRTLVHNEQTKLMANLLNVGSAGFFVTGIIAPLTNLGTTETPSTVVSGQALALMGIWMIAALILHYVGSLVLRNLR